jgi:hypothetical protein
MPWSYLSVEAKQQIWDNPEIERTKFLKHLALLGVYANFAVDIFRHHGMGDIAFIEQHNAGLHHFNFGPDVPAKIQYIEFHMDWPQSNSICLHHELLGTANVSECVVILHH